MREECGIIEGIKDVPALLVTAGNMSHRSKPVTENSLPQPPLKCCSRCEQLLPMTTDYFHRASAHADGFHSACKVCMKNKVKNPKAKDGAKRCSRCRQWFPSTREHFSPDKGNATTGLSSQCKACTQLTKREFSARHPNYAQIRQVEYRNANRDKLRAAKQRRRQEHPQKERAKDKVKYAVRKGRMMRVGALNCQICRNPAAHYHHNDYTKPLEVIPLCSSCHRRIHRKYA